MPIFRPISPSMMPPESPLVFMPGGMARAQMNYFPNFSSQLNYQHITKSAEVLTNPADI